MIKTFATACKGDITKKSGTLKVTLDTSEAIEVTYEFDDNYEAVTFWFDEQYHDNITQSDLKGMHMYIQDVLWKVIDGTWKTD